jgi:hypothetical protein
MRKRLLGVLLGVAAVILTVSVSSADNHQLPGSEYWIGATYQNVGEDVATLVVTAYDSTSNSTYPYSFGPLAEYASKNVSPRDIPNLPEDFVGSLVASADQPMVALINVTNRPVPGYGDPNGKAAGIYSAIDGVNTSTTLLFPLVKHNHFNKTTTFYLQNAGTVPSTITTDFTVLGVTYSYTSPSINPGQMVAVDPGMTTDPSAVPDGDGKVGSMTARSTQPIAGMMLEHEDDALVGTVMQASNAFADPDGLHATVYCPVVKKHHFGRSTGLQIMNAHSAAQTITVTYIDSNGNTYVSADPDLTNLAAGASTTLLDDPIIPYDDQNPGASVTLVSAIIEGVYDVAVIANESELPLVNEYQTATTYNCQPANTATTRLSYPTYKELHSGRQTALQIQNVGDDDADDVVLTFTDENGNNFVSLPQSIDEGAVSVFICFSTNNGLWNQLPNLNGETLFGVIVISDQPIVAVANEASWAANCTPNNGSGSFDKSTANAFNLDP